MSEETKVRIQHFVKKEVRVANQTAQMVPLL